MDTNIFAGDGSDTTFTLSTAPDTENNLMVFVDGVFQAQNVYSVSGTTLTFATAPANGRVITVYHSTTTVGGSNNTINTMTGDNSDTTLTLSVAPVHENNVQVYFDGVYQSKSNYAIDGTTLTFSAAPSSGTSNIFVNYLGLVDTSVVPADANKGHFKNNGMFRTNAQTLETSTTIEATENANVTGPLTIASGVTLTINSGGNVAVL